MTEILTIFSIGVLVGIALGTFIISIISDENSNSGTSD
jgi:hypothetical protein